MFWIVGRSGVLSQAFQRVFRRKNLSFVVSSKEECDVTNVQGIKNFAKGKSCRYIINCSGYTAVDLAEKQPQEAYAINAQGVRHLAMVAEEMQAKLIHFSTDYVFDGRKKTPYLESDETDPLNVYGLTKLEGEEILLQEFPSSLVVRISWLFSEEGPSFMKALWKAFLDKEKVEVITTQQSKPTYADDVVWAVEQIRDAEGLYHFANQDAVSRYDYAKEILAELISQGVSIKCKEVVPTQHVYAGATRPAYSALDTAKIEKLLGKPIRSHVASLKECIAACIHKEKRDAS